MDTAKQTIIPTKETALKILELLNHGLAWGVGTPEPGKMCVEAAVCFALGLPHSDEPPCVAPAVRRFKIELNDSGWSSNIARAQGLRRIAVAQLGSDGVDQVLFVKELVRLTVQKILPTTLRAVVKVYSQEPYRTALEEAGKQCEAAEPASVGVVINAAIVAANVARLVNTPAPSDAYYVAINASNAANAAAEALAKAANTAVEASHPSVRGAAYLAARSAVFSACAAARAATSPAGAARAADEVLTAAAEIGIEALQLCKSPGCEWLYLCE